MGDARPRAGAAAPAAAARAAATAAATLPAGAAFDGTPEAAALLAWMRAARFVPAGVTIARFSDTGRGVMATRDLPKGHCLFVVPPPGLLTAETAAAAAAVEAAASLPNAGQADRATAAADRAAAAERVVALGGWPALAVALLAERARGADSPWAAYLAALPGHVDTPLVWPPGMASALLRGTAAAAPAAAAAAAARAAHAAVVAPLLRSPARAGPSAKSGPTVGAALGLPPGSPGASIEAYLEACTIISSYAFTRSCGAPALVPFADFLNAVPGGSNARLVHPDEDEDEGERGEEDEEKQEEEEAAGIGGCFRMVTTRPVRCGEELLNTYGPHGNAHLLGGYGYVSERNPYHDVDIELIDILGPAAKAEARGRKRARGAEREGGGDGDGQPSRLTRAKLQFLDDAGLIPHVACDAACGGDASGAAAGAGGSGSGSAGAAQSRDWRHVQLGHCWTLTGAPRGRLPPPPEPALLEVVRVLAGLGCGRSPRADFAAHRAAVESGDADSDPDPADIFLADRGIAGQRLRRAWSRVLAARARRAREGVRVRREAAAPAVDVASMAPASADRLGAGPYGGDGPGGPAARRARDASVLAAGELRALRGHLAAAAVARRRLQVWPAGSTRPAQRQRRRPALVSGRRLAQWLAD